MKRIDHGRLTQRVVNSESERAVVDWAAEQIRQHRVHAATRQRETEREHISRGTEGIKRNRVIVETNPKLQMPQVLDCEISLDATENLAITRLECIQVSESILGYLLPYFDIQ